MRELLAEARMQLLQATLYQTIVSGSLGLGGGVHWLFDARPPAQPLRRGPGIVQLNNAFVVVSDPNSASDSRFLRDLLQLSPRDRQLLYRSVFECIGDAS